ncbi:hypothetical protein HS088_TW13G00079 [Tripterygium wilfordii]|uniref:Copper transport protein n=1 Tax=Tripterygium wilfordii TaxID=458696 RepID=A0A7J7CSZ6_TRIWF|nr:copper transporter 1-like [Tripterygium wilfordii]KAF5737201.1 hypothetical protein HS088_TW13G00079 [Tripterygium wilfordii]
MSNGDHGGMPMTPGSMSDGTMNSTTGDMDMNMIMHMSFYWGKDAIILFSGWPNRSLGMYILALFFIFLLALSIEILSVFPTSRFGINRPLLGALGRASVYAVRMGFAYLVMLSVMSYNLGIFIVAVAGHAIGFFVVKALALATANQAISAGGTPKA